jgi:hypothetical protein
MARFLSTYCDGCMTAAYDEGIDGWMEQILALDAASADMPDHQCDKVDNPGAGFKCDCLAHN